MSNNEQNIKYSNNKPLNLRTKISLKVLLLMYRTLSPYEYEHQFKKEIEDIAKSIDSYSEEQR